jgi:hypothetical protein
MVILIFSALFQVALKGFKTINIQRESATSDLIRVPISIDTQRA